MKYCSDCGNTVSLRVPEGDDRSRYICDHCQIIHYQNPRMVVGCVPVWQGQVLLCRRAIEPRKGYWTLPAGYMENGESTTDGAMRETWEEAQAKVKLIDLYRLYDLPYISQVYLFYRAEMLDGQFAPGIESLDVALFDEQDIPWKELAFPIVGDTLRDFFSDRHQGDGFPMRYSTVPPMFKR